MADIYLAGSVQPLLKIPHPFMRMYSGEEDFTSDRETLTLDQRVHFYAQWNLLLTIPKTNDRIVAKNVDLAKMLSEKGADYLYVTNIAPPGKISAHYHWRLEAASNAGGVVFSLQSGPAGLTVSKGGEVNWDAPAKPVEETVVVLLKDSSGQESFHTFRLVTTS